MPVEAEWDPVSCKVIYRHSSPDANLSSQPPSAENHPPNSSTDNGVSSDARRRSRSKTRKSKPSFSLDWREETSPSTNARSMGIAPQSFHGAASAQSPPLQEKPGQAYVRNLHAIAQQRNLEQQMTERRQEHAAQRHAFTQLTEYRTFPLQSRAIRRCRQLQVDWGLSPQQLYEESGISETDNAPAVAGDSQSSTSSASSTSSLEAPDRKRWMGDTVSSQTRVLQYHNTFLEERKIPPKSVAAPQLHKLFGPALYCLEPRIFAVETKKSAPLPSQQLASGTIPATSNEGGRRRYVVAHVGRFLDKYWCRTEPAWRHAYEVIPPRTPCRLYLDIECTEHPDLVGLSQETRARQEQVLDELFLELVDEVQEHFAHHLLECPDTKCSYKLQPLQRSDVVDLDSSTETKFSRHWIVHIPVKRASIDESNHVSSALSEALFLDAGAVGVFVRQWIGRLAEQQATHQLDDNHRLALQKYLFVSKKSKDGSTSSLDQPCCLVDLGVYTRNRLFRLMGSTKFGKPVTAALRIANANQFRFADGFGNHSFYVPELPTQSEREDTNASVDDIESRMQKSLSKTDWIPHAESLAETFVVPINVAKIDYPILPIQKENEARSLPPKFSRVIGPSTNASFGKSPYPMVDEYVQTHLASRGGTQGMIRAWTILRSADTNAPLVISYQMVRNRWCECIGREHKSNNISWNCDLVLFHCYQTCYDPDCRALNFRGTPIPLPSSVQEELQDALFEEALARLDITSALPPPPQDSKMLLPYAIETSNFQVQTKTDDVFPADATDADSSFDSALAALNLADTSITITDVVVNRDSAVVHESMKKSMAAEESVSPVKLTVQNVLAREMNDANVRFSDSDEESDIDLVALYREQERQNDLG